MSGGTQSVPLLTVSSNGHTMLSHKVPGYNIGDSMGTSPEAAPLEGKTVQLYGCRKHKDIYCQSQRMGTDPFCLLVQTVLLT